MDYHPISTCLPLMCEDELEDLADNIAAHRLLQPIVTLDGKILDGRNRYRACNMAGVEPMFEEFLGDESEAVDLVEAHNIHRRNLTASKRAQAKAMLDRMRVEAVDAMKEDARERQREGGREKVNQNSDEPPNERSTLGQRAKSAGVSRDTLSKADKIAAASPGLAQEVLAGKKTVNAAYSEVQDAESGSTPIKPLGKGIQHGHDAIASLKRIRQNDRLRDRGFEIVLNWIADNGPDGIRKRLAWRQ